MWGGCAESGSARWDQRRHQRRKAGTVVPVRMLVDVALPAAGWRRRRMTHKVIRWTKPARRRSWGLTGSGRSRGSSQWGAAEPRPSRLRSPVSSSTRATTRTSTGCVRSSASARTPATEIPPGNTTTTKTKRIQGPTPRTPGKTPTRGRGSTRLGTDAQAVEYVLAPVVLGDRDRVLPVETGPAQPAGRQFAGLGQSL